MLLPPPREGPGPDPEDVASEPIRSPTDEEAEAQRGEATCPRSHSWEEGVALPGSKAHRVAGWQPCPAPAPPSSECCWQGAARRDKPGATSQNPVPYESVGCTGPPSLDRSLSSPTSTHSVLHPNPESQGPRALAPGPPHLPPNLGWPHDSIKGPWDRAGALGISRGNQLLGPAASPGPAGTQAPLAVTAPTQAWAPPLPPNLEWALMGAPAVPHSGPSWYGSPQEL